jgi:hypothetical protein
MQSFPVLTIDAAPEKSKPALQALQGAFGMIPNVAGTMATSPVLIDSLVALFGKVHGGSFTEAQIQTILLTNAVTNGSSWAVAFHTGLALKEGLDQADVQAIRERRVPKDATSAALSTFARTLIEKRGRVDDHDVDAFGQPGSAGSMRWRSSRSWRHPPSQTILPTSRSRRSKSLSKPIRGAPDDRTGFQGNV